MHFPHNNGEKKIMKEQKQRKCIQQFTWFNLMPNLWAKKTNKDC